MNIAVNIARAGGDGGVARSLYSLVKAMESHNVDIYAMQFTSNGFDPRGKNTRINWFERFGDKFHIALDQDREYDLFFYYASRAPIYLGNYIKAKKRIVIPSGNDVRPIEKAFDYVYCEAEDGIRYFDDMDKKVVIIPCIIIPTDNTEKVEGLPVKYFLTVFNPYDLDRNYSDVLKPYKGHDLLYELADYLPLPLVWCHSDKYEHNIKEHSNVIHFINLEQEKMYYLYQKATAYVSFSREESFGYAIADAIMFDKPIISRNLGVITLLDAKENGLHLYNNIDELKNLLGSDTFDNPSYSKERFSPSVFEKRLISLL